MSEKTRYIVLRKTPFQENSFVVAGISADYGRLDFLWRGAKTLGTKKFPTVALFREFQVEFKESRNADGMQQLLYSELTASYDNISANINGYLGACGYGAFLLRHCKPMLPAPLTYQAFRQMLSKLSETQTAEPWLSLAKFVYLYENGYVPEFPDRDPNEKNQRISRLLQCALDTSVLPANTENKNAWQKFCIWVEQLCSYHSLDS